MQTFSGFNTKKQESLYNNCLEDLLRLLQSKIIPQPQKLLKKQFKITFEDIYLNLIKLEQSKFALPKFSESLKEMADFYEIKNHSGLPETIIEESDVKQ
jgi:hypothetical protein